MFVQSHPGGLLFTKFGANQTALLDLAFPVCQALTYFFRLIFLLLERWSILIGCSEFYSTTM